MDVELRDLKWAVIASQHRSLRRAAEVLNIRQSTLSRRIRDIEYNLGVKLFDRTNGGTYPTTAGKEFLDAARQIVMETAAIITSLKIRSNGGSGRLTIGVCAALSAGNLRAALTDYRHRFPDVGVRIVDGSRLQLLSDLSADVVDVVVMMGKWPQWADKTLPLWTERVVAALPENHPLSLRPVIHWTDLMDERLIVNQRDPGLEFYGLLIAKIGRCGLGQVMEHDVGLDRLLSLIGAGLGITLVAEGATGAFYTGVAYREIHDETGPTRLTFAAYWRQDNDNPTLQSFLAMLRERYPDLAVSSVESGV